MASDLTYDPHALIGFLESREDWTFGYGPDDRVHDCARFCGAGVAAVHGINPLAAFAATWTSEGGARRALARHGGMASAVDTVMRQIDGVAARRGDVGMTPDGALMLFEGDTVVGPGQVRGLVRHPRHMITIAWTVI